ncbi:Protein FREE1 [Glycine soja]
MQQGDYTSAPSPYYQFPHLQNPNPNPNPNPDPHPNNPYASAPPFNPNYAPSDYTPYPSYPQNPDPTPPTAPSFPPSSSNPNLPPPFNPPFESNPPYQQQQPYFSPYDQHQTPPNPNSTPSSYNPVPAPYSYSGPSSVPPIPTYEPAYEAPVRPDQGGGYFDDRYRAGFTRSHSDLGSDFYGKSGGGADDGYGDGVYAYEGGKVEPYGARGTAPKSSTWAAFDDYGRSISFPSQKESSSVGGKIVKAVPKADTQQDVKGGGVQKFRVKLLAESGGQSTMDVLCQIGLDGIRMLDPNTSRTLRIYPLENITRCDRIDSSTFAFWSKSPVDIEPRRIRLQSNSYTTNTLLDIVTAATIQFKEMGGGRRPAEAVKTNEQSSERKKGFGDWMNLIKPANEEKDHWVPDEAVSKCTACGTDFGAFVRRHHCRNCGDIFCDKCTHGRIALTADENAQPVRVCDRCMAEVTQRLTSAKESSSKPALQSHEDLAKKLQEELERNQKASGSKSDGSARRMKEVACPICTVHLQVQVPSSGSETIECGVCQHPFLVSAH